MFEQSNSTGKCKSKPTRKIVECSSCPKLTNKDYKRPQPVKIAQLLGLGHGENLKSVQKDTARKRIQPERLGAPSTSKSTQKKKRTFLYSIAPNTNVRRNLNFGVSYVSNKDKQLTRTNIPKLLAKKSLFLSSSTIKPKQLRKSSHKANVQSDTTVPKESWDISTSSATLRKNRRTCSPEMVTIFRQKVDTLKTPKYSTETGRNKLTNSIENLSKDSQQNATPLAFENNTDAEGLSSETIMVKKETIICLESTLKRLLKQSEENTMNIESALSFIRNLIGNSEIKKTMNYDESMKDNIMLDKEVQVNTFCKSPTKEQTWTINERNEIITNKIKTLTEINDNKENGNFNTSTIIAKMDVGNKIVTNEIKTLTEINENKETKNFNTPINTKMDDRNKITNETKKINENKENENFNTPINTKMDGRIKMTNEIKEIDENKGNKNSTVPRIFIGADDSFLQLENQLNITHANHTEICNNEACYSTMQKICTPVNPKQRSLREYMALKASVSFLQTPDSKRFRSLCQMNDRNNSDFNLTTISSKLLTDLDTLYSESPGSD